MASEKRCHYEVLGVSKDASPDEIRAAYRKLALQRHPDKLVQSGLSQADATALFQELVQAYEVLSDPKERAWYDSHRSQILFSDINSSSSSSGSFFSFVPNLFSFFSNTAFSGYSDSGKGFYKVFSDAFDRIYSAEITFVKKLGLGLDMVRQAPLMGNLDSPYSQVTAFYSYWLGFSTVMDFCWVDQYDVTAGPNRRSRRFFEEENKKLRKKAKREYNETVRELAGFVKKRDKRVIDMLVKKNEERERKREEEKEKKKKLERERLERASRYEEPEWARVVDEDEGDDGFEEEEVSEKNKDEFYCVACGKKFKSEKQWKNHEQSKKHKEKVAELRESFENEVEKWEEEEEEELDGEVEGLGERVEEGLRMEEREVEDGVGALSGEEEEEENDVFLDVDDENELDGDGDDDGFVDEVDDEDEEMSMLKAMVSGHKSRKKVDLRQKDEVLQTEVYAENGIDDGEVMEYDNRKSTRMKNKKEKGTKNTGKATKGDKNGTKDKDEEANGHDNSHLEEKSSSNANVENQTNNVRDDHSGKNIKVSKQPINGEGATEDKKARLKNSSKGKKAKAMSKNLSNVCENCGEEFESRNRLHKHLGDTGHATLKSR